VDANPIGLVMAGENSTAISIDVHEDRALQTTGPTQWKTLNYLYSIRGRGTVAGVHEKISSMPSQHTEHVFQISGKYPGLWSGDFLFDYNRRSRQNMIDEAKRRWNAGTMINIMYHSCNPTTTNLGEECMWDDGTKGPLSSMSNASWQELIQDGTALNRKWKQWLDEIAVYLQDLKNNGVEVLFRPFHEMNQGKFWWGGRPGPTGTLRLYQISHDYLTNDKRLDNLIWVWNVQDFGSLGTDVQNYNPGSNYYEVVSLDVYEGYQTWKYDVIRNIANGKPIAIGECDSLPNASRLANEPLWTFFMSWSELTFTANTDDQIRSVYNSQQVITRDEMGNWKNGAPPPTPTPPPVGGGGSLGDWTFCSSSSQCRNGCCSRLHSNDGRLKCTPVGGFQASHCVTGGGGPAPTPTPPPTPPPRSAPTPTPPPVGGIGSLGDWTFCSSSSQCRNGCCSRLYSNDRRLKCTPVGGFQASHCLTGGGGPAPTPTPPPVGGIGSLGDWNFCTTNSQCRNGCCSNRYSNDGRMKCTPGGC
jgi:mannan endo-1,4-beta-mannosidase